jgi:3-methyl-2-oxobutanoate hydroxymethyltransferase
MSEKVTLATLKKYKQQNQPITMLTCYDYATAILLEQAGIDGIIVGDSLAQVVLGYDSTLQANMDLMVTLTAAVRRGAPNVYLVGDMPFLSYQLSTEQAILNAGKFLREASCDAVKFELDHRYVELVEQLARAGIPVMAHLGYRPQVAGLKAKVVETRTAEQAEILIRDAQDIAAAGACCLLLECVTTMAAKAVTERADIPVISCGSGPHCDGQVIVLHELLDLPGASAPKFCKKYATLGDQIKQAVQTYIHEVRDRKFPDADHSYHMPPEAQADFEKRLRS